MNILNTMQSALGGGDKKDDLMSSIMQLLGGQGGLQNLSASFMQRDLAMLSVRGLEPEKTNLSLLNSYKMFLVEMH